MAIDDLTAILYKQDDLRLEQRKPREPGSGEVLVRMDSVGICGSDVHYWTHGAIGDFIVKAPMVIGHEAAGIVEKCGSGVTNIKPGDRVAIEPGVGCGFCDHCLSGRYNLCLEMKFCATPPIDGNLCRRYVHSAAFCHKLPDNVSLEEGALMEPLAVGVHACARGGVTLGCNVLVCGAGPIGLVNLLTALSMGAGTVVLTDIDQGRLDFAAKMGARTKLVKIGTPAEEVAREIREEFFDSDGPHVTIECSGAESSISTAIYATRSGGTVVLVGMGPAIVKIPVLNAACREVDIRGIFRYANCYPKAIAMVAGGKVNVKPLITHRFKLEETMKAFEAAKSGKDGAIKIMIKC